MIPSNSWPTSDLNSLHFNPVAYRSIPGETQPSLPARRRLQIDDQVASSRSSIEKILMNFSSDMSLTLENMTCEKRTEQRRSSEYFLTTKSRSESSSEIFSASFERIRSRSSALTSLNDSLGISEKCSEMNEIVSVMF